MQERDIINYPTIIYRFIQLFEKLIFPILFSSLSLREIDFFFFFLFIWKLINAGVINSRK